MASPFKHFRKHQKAMLAVIGILCMIGFTVGPSTMDWFSGQGNAADPIIATANGETMRLSNVTHMIQQRYLANQFVQGCLVMATGSEQMAMYQMLLVFNRNPGEFFGPTNDEDVVRTHLLAEEARRVGVVVSDEAVNRFLRDITNDKVPAEGYASLVKSLKTSQAQVFSALRTELAAQRLSEMSLPSAPATPAQRWDYYRRLKQRATIEAAPVRVAEFVDEVSDPSKEELAEFFAAHKEQEPDPLSPTPGFKIPKKAAFQYFVAEYDKFYDESAVTQEEIEKHYELYKDQKYLYSAFESPEFDEPAPEEKPEAEGDKAQPSNTGKTEGKAQADKPAEGKAESPEAKPENGKEPAEEKKSGDAQPAAEKSNDQSALNRIGPQWSAALSGLAGMTSSLLLADEETAAAGKAADETPASEKQATTSDKSADEKKPATEESSAPAKEESTAATVSEPPAAEKNAVPPPPISDELLLHRDIREGAKPKYAPLWRVESAIRKELAGQKAVEKMTKALDAIQLKMSRYRRNLSPDEEFEGEDEAEPRKQPELPDFSELVKANNLSEHETELLSAQALQDEHPQLADATPDQQNPSERPRKFVDVAYSVMPTFRGSVVKDLGGNRYLIWKTADQEAYVPELADVRDEVVHSWKLVKARDVARKRAEAMAEEAQKANKPLKEVFNKRDVMTTSPFSWLTRGASGAMDSQATATLSEIEGIQDAGPDFMREVFNLRVGDVGQAMNQPQTICYVVRVVSIEPSREVLRTQFMVDPYSMYEAASVEDRREVVNAWVKGLEHEANLSWKRPPNEPR